MTAPTIINPGPAPSRTMPEDEFESTANGFFGRLPGFATSLQESLEWADLQFTAVEEDRQATEAAAQSASDDAAQTAEDRVQTGQDRTAAEQAAQSASGDAEQTAADRVQTGEDRAATEQYRNQAQQYRNEAQAISVGDVRVSDLLPPFWELVYQDQTLSVNMYYKFDTATGPLNLTLPANPAKNDWIRMYLNAGTLVGTVFDPGSDEIMGRPSGETLEIDYEITSINFVYNGAEWRVFT